jgi:hypothetical protein
VGAGRIAGRFVGAVAAFLPARRAGFARLAGLALAALRAGLRAAAARRRLAFRAAGRRAALRAGRRRAGRAVFFFERRVADVRLAAFRLAIVSSRALAVDLSS